MTPIRFSFRKKPQIPNGYEEVPRGQQRRGDLGYNVLSHKWQKIPDFILLLGEKHAPLVHNAIRRVEKREESSET